MSLAAPAARVRTRIRVTGTVQGVGFRPFVYRLAGELGLSGFVLNDAHGVLIEAEGMDGDLKALMSRLRLEAPPLAVVENVTAEACKPRGRRGFTIEASPRDEVPNAPVTPDTATCRDCLHELFDPGDRRFRYPFINCTNCGPRFTIVTGVPYDRPFTTMAGFHMCARCRAEYENPADRRFHAQPNACPDCGPAVRLVHADGAPARLNAAGDEVEAAAAALREGAIVAVKGLGGFHLACRADDDAAVARLRARKHREDKPFALMVSSFVAAEELVVLEDRARELLGSSARPIVLAPRLRAAAVAPSVAPGFIELGVMLPYSPLHHLLLGDLADLAPECPALVMTSGNVSDEPIAYRDKDALERLAAIADLFLLGERPIHTRTDDSVIRMVPAPRPRQALLRRSRGYVPASLPLPKPGTPRPLLACGAQLKNTFCLAKKRRAWVSHHIGDLENYETLCSFTEGIDHFGRLFAVEPEVVVHDLHPEYLSTKFAFDYGGVELVAVQHHHAHLAACLAEHGESGPAIGAVFDGSGYGTDGTVWGGELLVGDLRGFERVGHLWPVRLPGGDRAVEEPWRMACAWLSEAYGGSLPRPASLRADVGQAEWEAVAGLVTRGLRAPWTSSIGRLFDAVAALCGIRARVSYEGQAAVELEAAADGSELGQYSLPVTDDLNLDARQLIADVHADVESGAPAAAVSSRFHRALATATAEACCRVAEARGIDRVVLSGGVFQNRLLLELTSVRLEAKRVRVLVPEQLPSNDGGVSYGQAAVAAARLRP